MMLICMRTNNESMVAFGETHGKVIGNLVCQLWRNFPRFEALAYLICYDIVLLSPPGNGLILTLGIEKFCIRNRRIAFIGANIIPILGFAWILCVLNPLGEALRNGFTFIYVH